MVVTLLIRILVHSEYAAKTIARLTPASPFEHLPWELKAKIFEHLDGPDLVCLGLSCTMMMRSPDSRFKKDPWDTECDVEFMDRLRSWMPAHLILCYHCLTYLPPLDFGPQQSEFSKILCMDCKFYSQKKKFPEWMCLGCEALDREVEWICDHDLSLDPEYVWDQVLGGTPAAPVGERYPRPDKTDDSDDNDESEED